MGGICSSESSITDEEDDFNYPKKRKRGKSSRKQTKNVPSFSDVDGYEMVPPKRDPAKLPLSLSGELKPSSPARTASSKVLQMSSILRRAGVGQGRAGKVLATMTSSMSNLNVSTGYVSGRTSRKNKISILAFEVANTIVKGANILQSLSKGNIQFLKKEILHSEGVQRLISTDLEELLSIAAADKREEFDVFSREVIRFGNLCKDTQWHNLGLYFKKLDSETSTHGKIKEEVEMTMQELTILALNTAVKASLLSSAVDGMIVPVSFQSVKILEGIRKDSKIVEHFLHGLSRQGMLCGYCTPLQTLYISEEPPPFLSRCASIVTISLLPRYVLDSHLSTLTSRLKKVPLDFSPVVIGLGTFLRQFNPTYMVQYVQYMCQYIKIAVEAAYGGMDEPQKRPVDSTSEALKSAFWLLHFCKHMELPEDLANSCLPPLLAVLQA